MESQIGPQGLHYVPMVPIIECSICCPSHYEHPRALNEHHEYGEPELCGPEAAFPDSLVHAFGQVRETRL